MQVLCLVLVIVYAGLTCHGIQVYQAPSYTLDRVRQALSRNEKADPVKYSGHRGNDINHLKKLLRTTLKNREIKNKIISDGGSLLHPSAGVLHNQVASSHVRMGSHANDKRYTNMADYVPVSFGAIKRPDVTHHFLHPPVRAGRDKDENKGHPWRHVRPSSFHLPTEMPEATPCKNPRGVVENIATAPPNVCDLCPSENGKNPLDPCTCVGVGGSSAGMISISCPSSIVNLEQLRDIFHNTNFFTTHVFQFSLQRSNADGALTRDIWGDLDFKYVSINYNKITDVDNGAFIGSSSTLIGLDLANNEIKSFIAMYNNLPNLLYLNLRGNNISLIYSEDFQYPELTDLDLSHNQISSIGTHSFAALKKLRSLNLSYNLLTSIGDERFTFIDHNYSNVLVIDLSYNKISLLSENAFLGLRSVEIDFRFNQLHTLQEKIFSPIILDSQYFVFFHFIGNEMKCDCDLLWVVEDGNTLLCFDNFQCFNTNKTLYSLDASDLGNCSNNVQHL